MEEEYSHLVYLIIIHYCDCLKHTHIRPVLQLFSLPVAARARILGNSILMMAEGPFFCVCRVQQMVRYQWAGFVAKEKTSQIPFLDVMCAWGVFFIG